MAASIGSAKSAMNTHETSDAGPASSAASAGQHEYPRADDRAYRHRRPLKPSYLPAEPSVFVVHDNVTSIV